MGNINETKNKYFSKDRIIEYLKDNRMLSILIIVFFLIILFLIFKVLFIRTDSMEQSGIYKVSYRVYENGKWSNWTKNGLSIGSKNSNINKIDIKIPKQYVSIEYFYNNNWHESNKKNNEINAIRIHNTATFLKKYDVYYRTYNKKNGWLDWTCNGNISGNINENIGMVEIKIIPKNVVKYDYLKSYADNNNKWEYGF